MIKDILAQTQTLEDPVNIYETAQIEIREFRPDEVSPICLYVLNDNLATVYEIYTNLLNEGIDIFKLTDICYFYGGIISPPVVELSNGIPVILDGLHRFYIAREMGISVNAVYIEGATMPILFEPVTWSEVIRYDVRPEDPTLIRRAKPEYSDTKVRKYYRNLSKLGSKGRRPLKTQNG